MTFDGAVAATPDIPETQIAITAQIIAARIVLFMTILMCEFSRSRRRRRATRIGEILKSEPVSARRIAGPA
jgi:hypothetical protein